MTAPVTPLVALSWAVVVVAFAGTLRVALKPPFRRDLAALPALRAGLVVSGLLAMSMGALVLLRVVVLLHLTALACLTAMAYLWWRARPSYGRVRGWPPGSLGLGASLDAIDQREYYLEQAARHGPVFKMSQFGRPVLCIVGLARGRQLLQDHRTSLGAAALPYNRFVSRGMLRYMPHESHHAEGPLFRRAFSSTVLDADELAVRAACRRRLAAFAPTGGDIRPVIRGWIVESLADAFFGLRTDDARVGVLDAAQSAMNLQLSAGKAWGATIRNSLESANVVIKDAAREQLERGDSKSILGALIASAPESLDDEGRLRNLFLIYRLGISDLSDALTWVAYQLSAQHEWQARVRTERRSTELPPGAPPDALASRVVHETLRLEQSEFLYRRSIKPFDFEGFHVPAGWIVRICIQESHRDPQTFPDPATFNPDRFLGKSFARSEYATFGLDGHGCMGTSLVSFFGRIFVEELCAEYTT